MLQAHFIPPGPRRLALVLLFGCGLAMAATPPMIKEMRPPGSRAGQAFELRLSGAGLSGDLKIHSTLPATFTPLSRKAASRSAAMGEAKAPEVAAFLVEMRQDVPVGLYPLRVSSQDGMSNLVLFSVGAFPEVAETEVRPDESGPRNDTLATAESVQPPVTINGSLDGPDRDWYRFRARRGERLVLEVEARRAGSAIDPVLRLYDAKGLQIAVNNDAPGLGHDARIDYRFPADGDYYVEIHDARFSLQDATFYRLKIGSFDYAEAVFPLGWKRGSTREVELIGGSFDTPRTVTVDFGANPAGGLIPVPIPGKPGALPLLVRASDFEERLKPASGPLALEPGVVVNGRLEPAGEPDTFTLEVKPGEEWLIELEAAGAGLSPLYGVLSAYDAKGKRIASSGDDMPDAKISTQDTGTVSGDPFLRLELGKTAQTLRIEVGDLLGRGGPAFGYRLMARKIPFDFSVQLSTPYVNIPAGGAAFIQATATRKGYEGLIELVVEGLPEGVTASGGNIPDGVNSGFLTLSASGGAPAPGLELSVWAQARASDGTVIRRRAEGPGLMTAVRPGNGLPNIALRIAERPAIAPWLGLELPASLTPTPPGRLEVTSPSHIRLVKGGDHALAWKFVPSSPGVRPPRRVNAVSGAREVRINREDGDAEYVKEGVFQLVTTTGTPMGRFDLTLAGTVSVDGADTLLYSPAVTFDVVNGYELKVPESGIALAPGGRAEVRASVHREESFPNPIQITPDELPAGVACPPVSVPQGESDFTLVCTASAAAEPGEYEIALTSSSTMVGRGTGIDVPYTIDPAPLRLVVGRTVAAER